MASPAKDNGALFKYMHQTPTFSPSTVHCDRSNLVSINKNEFIMAADHDLDTDPDECRTNGIFSYNIKENEWKLLIPYPKDFQTHYQSICYDPKHKNIYLYGDESNLVIINLITKEFIIHEIGIYLGQKPAMLFIRNQLHLIAGSDSKSHLIWQCQSQQNLSQNHENSIISEDVHNPFEPLYTFPTWNKGVHGHGVIHLKTRSELILFGGYDYGMGITYDGIWKYSIPKNKWHKLSNIKLEFAVYKCGYIVTMDERWIILFGGFMGTGDANIYLLDIDSDNEDEYRLYRSSLKCPTYGNYEAICVGKKEGEIIVVNGYCKSIDMNIPYEIVGLLEGFYCQEEVHLINKEDHVKIKVDDIINAEMTLIQ